MCLFSSSYHECARKATLLRSGVALPALIFLPGRALSAFIRRSECVHYALIMLRSFAPLHIVIFPAYTDMPAPVQAYSDLIIPLCPPLKGISYKYDVCRSLCGLPPPASFRQFFDFPFRFFNFSAQESFFSLLQSGEFPFLLSGSSLSYLCDLFRDHFFFHAKYAYRIEEKRKEKKK